MPRRSPYRFVLLGFIWLGVAFGIQANASGQAESVAMPNSRPALQARALWNKTVVKATKDYQNQREDANKNYIMQLKAALRRAKKASDVGEVRRITVEMERVQSEIALQTAKSVFLDDLEPTGYSVGHGKLGLHGDIGHNGIRVKVNKQRANHSLSTHAEKDGVAHVSYLMPMQFSRLTGVAAFADSAKPKVNVIFSIEGDGRLLWHSSKVVKRQPVPFDIDVTGVQHLKLLITCKGSSAYGHTVWLEPLLSQK